MSHTLDATYAKKPKSDGAAKPTYRDVREYLAELEKRHLLQRVTRPMNKDTEIMPLVRWQFRGGLPESQRKGWLFASVTDSRGRKFDGSVAVAIIGASTEVYAAAMGVKSAAEIAEKWKHAQAHPIAPIEVSANKAPVKQVKILGKDLISTGGIDKLPITITNPGSDSSAYFSAPCCDERPGDRRLQRRHLSRHGQGARSDRRVDHNGAVWSNPLGEGASVRQATRGRSDFVTVAIRIGLQRKQVEHVRV